MKAFDSILVLGGGGMLAHALQRALRHRKLRHVALDRSACDITDPEALRGVFRAHRPTLVLNAAAYTKVDLCEEHPRLADAVNGYALEAMSQLAGEFHTKLVHYSTDFVFDGRSTRPYQSGDVPNPLSAYGRSKLLGEQMIQQVDPPGWLMIRTAWLYGPAGPCFPQTMLTLARQGVPLRVVCDQVGSPTLTFDLADATLNLLECDATGLWHVTNTGQATWLEFTEAVLNEFRVDTDPPVPITSEEWKRSRPRSAVRPAYSVLDTTGYEQLTGKPLRAWREALHAYAQECGAV